MYINIYNIDIYTYIDKKVFTYTTQILFNRNTTMSNLNGRDSPKSLKILQNGGITEEAEALTIHGWPRAISAKSNISRLAWSALCLTATGLLIYFTVKSLLKHSKHEVTVNVNRKQLSAMKFPAITFCNTNLYSKTAYQNTPPPVYQELPRNCSMDQAEYFENEINREFFKLGCKMFFGNKKLFTSQLSVNLGYKFKFPAYFSLLPHAYPCFTFNNGSWFTQSIISSKAGLHFVLDFDWNDRSKDAQTASSDSVLEDERSGIYVTIHSPGDFHIDTGISLSPGFETRISIQKSIIKRKKSPFPSKCLDDNEQQFINVFPGKPSLDSCYSSCYFLNMYRKCHFLPSYMKAFMPEVFTSQFLNTSCTKEELQGADLVKNCKCRLPCYKEQYVPSVMQSVWPQEWQAEQFQELLMGDSDANRSISISEIRKRLIKVVVYYTDLAEYSYEERELYDMETILSDFGGQMGLFVGASVISLAEIASLLWFCVTRAIKGKQKVRGNDET